MTDSPRSTVIYRAAAPADFDAVRRFLSDNGWQARVADPQKFQTLIANSDRTVIAWDGPRIVGFARALCDGVSNGYLSMVAVAPDRRREGIGRALVQHLTGDDPDLTWVLRAGRGSEEFWRSLGFAHSTLAMERTRGNRDAMQTAPALARIDGIPSQLLYHSQGLDGALPLAYLSALALPHLAHAARILWQQSAPGRSLELLIWDAYRTPQTQTDLYERYVRELMADEGLTYDEAYPKARAFVASPTAVFPHGTGGAVDVTLLINGEAAPMGTGFDDFVPQSASDWYRQNPPQTEADRIADVNRETLRRAMLSAGFVGLDSEWWHFEWGTHRWARATRMAAVLDTVLAAPGDTP